MELAVAVVAYSANDSYNAVQTAWSARPLGKKITVVAPKDSIVWPLPDDCSWVTYTADVAATASKLIPTNGAVLVLQAGETLTSDDWVAAAHQIEWLPAGTPAIVTTHEGPEQRIMVPRRTMAPVTIENLNVQKAASAPAPKPPVATPLHMSAAKQPTGKFQATPVAQLPVPPIDATLIAAASQPDADGPQELVAELCRVNNDRALLAQVRSGRRAAISSEKNPLVTVRIATYNRGPLVAERSIRSALAQTYENIEVVVVGDNCDAATEEAVRGVKDPRITFLNLPHRGLYPATAEKRWMVAGAHPMNMGMMLAKGSWMAPCDDDDEFTEDHIEVLLRAAQDGEYEMVYSKSRMENPDGSWRMVGSPTLREGGICHGSVLFSIDLRFIQHSMTCHRMDRPADFVMWRRMSWAGVRMGYVDHETFIHYAEAREINR